MIITVFERNIFTGRVTERPATGQATAGLRNGQCIRVAYSSGRRDWHHLVPVVSDPARPSSYLTGGGQTAEIWAGVQP